MTRVTIHTESPAASRALEVVVRDGNGVEARVAAAGALPSVIDLSDRDLLLISRGLPREDILRILGRSWAAPRAPRILFLDTCGVNGDEPLELEPTCAERLLERVDQSVKGGSDPTSPLPLLFRPLERPPHLRPLSAEPIDEETFQAIVA